MDVNSAGGVTAANVAAASTAASPASSALLGGLDGEAFLNLLVAQLRYQNPSEPTDTTALMQQTSQLAQVETMQQIAEVQQELVGLQQTSLASNLVGREVSYENQAGDKTQGTVEAVRFTVDGPLLLVDGTEVPFGAAMEIRARSGA